MSKRKSATETLTTGIVMCLIFGFLWSRSNSWIWLFPLAFAGILPTIEGVRRFLADRQKRRRIQKIEPAREAAIQERKLLKLAKAKQGVLTPTQVAVDTDLTIEESEELLQKFVSRGYAAMEVGEDGRIRYEFPEFQPRLGDGTAQ